MVMGRRFRITRMDDWDIPARKHKLKGKDIPLCDLRPRPALHQIGSLVYFSQFRRTKTGTPFGEIKQSAEIAQKFAEAAVTLISRIVHNTDGWAVITTPRRRHSDGFHFATEVCTRISEILGIPFHMDAVQCVNRCRIDPEFHLLRPIKERKLIVYDDIITTGSTLSAMAALLSDRDIILNLIGISNR